MDSIISSILNSKRNILLVGPGGCGKSTIIKRLYGKLKQSESVGLTAATGVAAVLIGGRTLHSFLGIGLAKGSVSKIINSMKYKTIEKWRTLDYLIVDEISMISNLLLEKIERIAKILRKDSRPFGGITLIFSGDFLQLPSVEGDFVFKAECWNELNFQVFNLTQIYRQTDATFLDILERARFGRLTDADAKILMDAEYSFDASVKPVKLFCKKVNVEAYNLEQLVKLGKGEWNEYDMEVAPSSLSKRINPESYSNAPKSLKLAIGAQVMLLVNLDIECELINGSVGIVIGWSDSNLPIVNFSGKNKIVDFYEWEVENEFGKEGGVFQIPLALAWATTIHKSQGSTLDCVEIDLTGTFEYGQAYVALSRVKNLGGLKIKNVSQKHFRAHPEALKFYENLNKIESEQENIE